MALSLTDHLSRAVGSCSSLAAMSVNPGLWLGSGCLCGVWGCVWCVGVYVCMCVQCGVCAVISGVKITKYIFQGNVQVSSFLGRPFEQQITMQSHTLSHQQLIMSWYIALGQPGGGGSR